MAVAASLVAALVFLALWFNREDRIGEWLLLQHLRHWAYGAAFLGGCLSTGWRLLRLLIRVPPPLGERLAYALGIGVVVFASGVFIAGLGGVLGQFFFFAWPIALVLFGAPTLVRDGRRILPRLRRFGARLYLPRTGLEAAAAVALFLMAVALYLHVITPENVGFDARSYHLPIADHYRAAGKIRAFPEGSYLGASPQLASLLYTWAFLAPGRIYEHTVLSAHVEWFLFLATLPAVGALARRLGGGRRLPYAAAAFCLFPAIFLHDANLNAGADHILAFWAAPVALALFRYARLGGSRRFAPEPGTAVLLGVLLAGAILTKYQALYFVVPAALVVASFALATRKPGPAALFVLTVLVVTASHWLKNAVFYGNPFYPLFGDLFPSNPFHPGSAALIPEIFTPRQFALAGTWAEKLVGTAGALFNFSFVAHDRPALHGARPVFGSLFTLLLPLLFFARPPVRLWQAVAAIHIAIAIWYVTSHQDRFLQALLPWIAATTAALLVLAWQRLPQARVLLVALVGFQLVAGSDLYFLRTHTMVGDSPLKPLVNRIAAGHAKKGADRYRIEETFTRLSRELPTGTRVLLHDIALSLGLRAERITDGAGWQSRIDYTKLESPARVVALWRTLGATQVLWRPVRDELEVPDGRPVPDLLSWAREAVFMRTLKLADAHTFPEAEFRLTTLRTQVAARAAAHPTRIAWFGCNDDPKTGLYTPRGLVERTSLRTADDEKGRAALVDAANALIVRTGCATAPALADPTAAGFDRVLTAKDLTLYVRRAEATP